MLENQPLTWKELQKKLQITSKSTLAKKLELLEKQGLIICKLSTKKHRGRGRKRIQVFHITDKGLIFVSQLKLNGIKQRYYQIVENLKIFYKKYTELMEEVENIYKNSVVAPLPEIF